MVTARLGCPRCSTRLVQRSGQQVADCPRCSGTFYDSATLRRIIEDVKQLAGVAQYSRPPLSLKEEARYLPCPICEELMLRRNFGKSSGVIVDVCAQDGVWFDDRELQQVLDFCASGELAKSERFDRERARARQQLAEFKREVDRAGPMHYAGGFLYNPIYAIELMEDVLSGGTGQGTWLGEPRVAPDADPVPKASRNPPSELERHAERAVRVAFTIAGAVFGTFVGVLLAPRMQWRLRHWGSDPLSPSPPIAFIALVAGLFAWLGWRLGRGPSGNASVRRR